MSYDIGDSGGTTESPYTTDCNALWTTVSSEFEDFWSELIVYKSTMDAPNMDVLLYCMATSPLLSTSGFTKIDFL